MKRRNFIQLMSAAASIALLPSTAKAEENKYEGPLFIYISTHGGWDVTNLCDPKGHEVGDSEPYINKLFTRSQIKPSTSAPDIVYAPIGIDYKFKTFFDKYGQDLLVVNGIDHESNGHGGRYAATGRLEPGYPTLGALMGAIYLPDSPLGYLANDGFTNTQGIIAKVELQSSEELSRFAFPNKRSPYRTGNYMKTEYFDVLTQSHTKRVEVLKKDQSLEGIVKNIDAFDKSHISSKDINKMIPFITEPAAKPVGYGGLFSQGLLALSAYQAGLTVSVSLEIDEFDSHTNNDSIQEGGLGRLLEHVDFLMQEAENRGLKDKVVIMMGSDFGRTPTYNHLDGKDHWGIGSMMILGGGIKGGRVVGKSTERHLAMKINPSTLEVDEENGIYITPAHVHKSMRKFLGLSEHKYVAETFNLLSTEDMDIVI